MTGTGSGPDTTHDRSEEASGTGAADPASWTTPRLDRVLIDLGYIDEEQVRAALVRQSRHGGRFGMNLVRLGIITEEQLLTALSKQFGLPTRIPEAQKISRSLIEKVPPELLATGGILPLAWDAEKETLTVAVANPRDQALITEVMEAVDARRVRVMLAPERQLAAICEQLVPAERPGAGEAEAERPALRDRGLRSHDPVGREGQAPPPGSSASVLMVTEWDSHKELLPPLFEREGYELHVASRQHEVAAVLSDGAVGHVLVSEAMRGPFEQWESDGAIRGPASKVTFFSGIGEALLRNPLPYDSIVRSLKSSVQALADYRSFRHGAAPPYRLIAFDVEALAQIHALPRVAVDGLHLAVHLLIPSNSRAGRGPARRSKEGSRGPFADFGPSLELASRLRFPWRLDAVLNVSRDLFVGDADPMRTEAPNREIVLAAQILALAWHRHVHLSLPRGDEEEAMVALREALIEEAGSLAAPEVVEAYVHLITEQGSALSGQVDEQVLLVGGDRLLRALGPALDRLGRAMLATDDLADAQGIVERRPPAATVIDHEVFPGDVDKFSRVARLGGSSLLFAVTDSRDPRLIMDLLDVGLDDVFGPPHDFDLIGARVDRAIRSRLRALEQGGPQAGQFSATFEVFSFLDLIQMLSQGMKSVRVDLNRDGRERAVLFMERGRIVHASGSGVAGEEALYRVIAWEDQGEFTVTEERNFPPPTIERSTDSLLMEGLRLLDESKR